MQVHYITPLDRAQRLDMTDEDVSRIFGSTSPIGWAKPFEGAWTAPDTWRFKKPRKRKIEDLADVTAVLARCDSLVMSERAKSVLEPLLGDSAQWLPLAFPECEYWLLNLLRVVEMDDDAEIDFPPSRTDNGFVYAYSFRTRDVENEWLFKARKGTYAVLCTDRFIELVKREKLSGFWFGLVWDSDHKPFRDNAVSQEVVRSRPEIYGPHGILPSFEHFWPEEWKALNVLVGSRGGAGHKRVK
jgi:hypothetical protein